MLNERIKKINKWWEHIDKSINRHLKWENLDDIFAFSNAIHLLCFLDAFSFLRIWIWIRQLERFFLLRILICPRLRLLGVIGAILTIKFTATIQILKKLKSYDPVASWFFLTNKWKNFWFEDNIIISISIYDFLVVWLVLWRLFFI